MFIDGHALHFRSDGEAAAVVAWIPRAKSLFRRMLELGLTMKVDTPAQDVEIRVDRYSIYIKAGGLSLESGLYTMAPPRFNGDQIDPTWPIVQDNGDTRLAYQDFYPRKEKQKSSIYGGWGPSYKLAHNYTKADNKLDSIIGKTPGRYAGTMRKVVQLLIGQGKPVPYNYQWRQCHGIYTAADGRPWVVEISAAGVRAWKLPRTKLDPAAMGTVGIQAEIAHELGYVPRYQTIEQQAKAAKTLLDAGSMAEFYDKGAMFSACGWAFSYSGASAQNTCANFPGADGGYMRSYRYSIDITEAKGEPAFATLSLQKTGIVYGDRVSGFKVPVEEMGMCLDFDLYYGKTPYRYDSDGPLYCFYKADGALVTVDMTPGVASVFTNEWSTWGGSDAIGAYGDGFTNKSMNHWTDNAPKVSEGYSNEESYSGSWEVIEIDASNRNGFFTSSFGEEGGRSIIVNEFRGGTLQSEFWANPSIRDFTLSAVVPYYDRESVYSIKRVKEYGQRSTKAYGYSTFIRGTVVACLDYRISAACSGGSGWNYRAEFASDPRIGNYAPTWIRAGFSRELPYLPTGTDAICAAPLPFLGANGVEVITPQVYAERVVVDAKLITSTGSALVAHKEFDSIAVSMDDPTDRFFDFWDGGNLRWMAAYRDAFTSHDWVYAYRAPNEHTDLFMSVDHYPVIDGTLVPISFVGKP